MGFSRWPRFAAMCLVVALALVLAGCSGSKSPAAATFGDHTIFEDEVTGYTAAYRAQNGLEDDADWALFVTQSYGDAKTWREEAIRVLADHVLIEEKANELGLSVDEGMVEEEQAKAKKAAGIDPDDEQAWSDHLASMGMSAQEYREKLEYSSIEQQVYREELDFTDEVESEMCSAFIKDNYADQIMHHYWAIPFDDADSERAQDCLDELEGLEGDALRKRFVEMYDEETGGAASGGSYDIGWDFLYGEGRIDPGGYLRSAQLPAGKLYDGLLEGNDAARIVLCDEVVELVDTSYDAIESESFKSIIRAQMLATTWAAQCSNYLSDLEEAANIQVIEMPQGLPYAFD